MGVATQTESTWDHLARHIVGTADTRVDVVSPTDGSVLGNIPTSTQADVEHAYQLARQAQRAWAQTSVRYRSSIILKFHDLLLAERDKCLDLVQSETGKARKDALEELLDICVTSRHYARTAPKLLSPRGRLGVLPGVVTVKEQRLPKGVVGVISPWNYPLTLAASDAIPALLAGNGIVLKPDSKTPFTALWIADVLQRAGIPDGLFNVVVGDGPVLGPVMVENSNYMMFTGSTAVGRLIASGCGEQLIGCSLELGGKNAMVILPDADLEKAVDLTIRSVFANSGQLCIAMERVYVPAHWWDEYTALLRDKVSAMKLSPRVGWGANMGSLIDEKQLANVQHHVDDAVANGAEVLVGGKHRPELGPFVFEPTVLTGVTEAALACKHETFGPVVSLYPYEDEAEAIARANDTVFGLNAAVVTGNLRHGQVVADQLHSGTVNINEGYAAAWGSTATSMGGMGDSGLGRRHGDEGILKYTESQSIATMRALGFDPQFGMDDKSWGEVLTMAIKVMKRVGVR